MVWKLILLCFSLSFFASPAFSQNSKLFGNWVKISATRSDGSTAIDRSNINLLEMDLMIAPDYFCVRYYPLRKESCYSYSYDLYKKIIYFDVLAWRVLDVNQDKLVLSIPANMDKNNTIITFEREESFYQDYEIEKEGDFVIATSKFSPFFNASLQPYLEQAIKINKTTGRAIADLKIDFNKEEIRIDWKETKGFVDKSKIEEVFNESFRLWQNVSNEYDKYIIPFTVQSTNYHQDVKFIFYSDEFQSPFDIYKVSNGDLAKSKRLFEKAHIAFKKENYIEALKEFKACYEINHTDLRAMYNVALIYKKLGQNRNACEVYQHLIDRGQLKAKALSEKNCKSN